MAKHLCQQAGCDLPSRYLSWDSAEDREKIIHETFPSGPGFLILDEAREYLLAVLRGESRKAEREIRSRYREFLRLHATGQGVDFPKGRTIGELRALVQGARKERERHEALELERERIERERKRSEHLKEVAKRFPHWWEQADAHANEQKASSYDLARDILVDLRDAYAQEGRQEEFATRLQSFASKYARRPALMRRLKNSAMEVSAGEMARRRRGKM